MNLSFNCLISTWSKRLIFVLCAVFVLAFVDLRAMFLRKYIKFREFVFRCFYIHSRILIHPSMLCYCMCITCKYVNILETCSVKLPSTAFQ